ncbi:MAG: hypothetical protein JEZ06_08705 [Anaerolineaceae bacterium]|nr:hypothetical protein [Anaerolineaceae bacterium]
MSKFTNKTHNNMIKKARRISEEISCANYPIKDNRPILIFNTSTRISTLSLNASFSLLSSWFLKIAGYKPINIICDKAINCIFNQNRDIQICRNCLFVSNSIFSGTQKYYLRFQNRESKFEQFANFSFSDLENFSIENINIGKLVLPSVRWLLRRHTIEENEENISLYKKFIVSAWDLYDNANYLFKEFSPQAILLFNGVFFPEAIFRLVANKYKIRTITHEVGMKPLTSFFSHGLATDYPMKVEKEFKLSNIEKKIIDKTISKRKTGNFRMAGINFWPKVLRVSPELTQIISQHDTFVTIFTNVIFDTSQINANIIFPNMFEWLNHLINIIKEFPNVFFVIRAHPDENRPGKESVESVFNWYIKNNHGSINNLAFIDPNNPVSSYELISKSSMILVYNSTIGLEASILGKKVICAAKSRYSQFDTVDLPLSIDEYLKLVKTNLTKLLPIDHKKVENANKVFYFQFEKYSIPFDKFIFPIKKSPGHVGLKNIKLKDLEMSNSNSARIIVEGITEGKEFRVL